MANQTTPLLFQQGGLRSQIGSQQMMAAMDREERSRRYWHQIAERRRARAEAKKEQKKAEKKAKKKQTTNLAIGIGAGALTGGALAALAAPAAAAGAGTGLVSTGGAAMGAAPGIGFGAGGAVLGSAPTMALGAPIAAAGASGLAAAAPAAAAGGLGIGGGALLGGAVGGLSQLPGGQVPAQMIGANVPAFNPGLRAQNARLGMEGERLGIARGQFGLAERSAGRADTLAAAQEEQRKYEITQRGAQEGLVTARTKYLNDRNVGGRRGPTGVAGQIGQLGDIMVNPDMTEVQRGAAGRQMGGIGRVPPGGRGGANAPLSGTDLDGAMERFESQLNTIPQDDPDTRHLLIERFLDTISLTSKDRALLERRWFNMYRYTPRPRRASGVSFLDELNLNE